MANDIGGRGEVRTSSDECRTPGGRGWFVRSRSLGYSTCPSMLRAPLRLHSHVGEERDDFDRAVSVFGAASAIYASAAWSRPDRVYPQPHRARTLPIHRPATSPPGASR